MLALIPYLIAVYILLRLLTYYINANNDYWPKRGVPRALLTEFGSYFELITGKKKIQYLDMYYYNKYKDAPYVGTMELRNPVLFIRDMELVKKIMVKDFEYFLDRRKFPVGADPELSDRFLFNMHGNQWKDLRSAMSPTFTTGKIRHMYDYFHKSGSSLIKFIKSSNNIEQTSAGKSHVINLRDAYGRFTMDIVASTAFGMDSKSFVDDNSMFFLMGKKFLNFSLIRTMKTFAIFFAPKFARFFNLTIVDLTSLNFFMSMVRQVIKQRRQDNTVDKYNDFLSLMMKTAAETSNNNDSKTTAKITDDIIVANSMAFFLAGFDVTESVLSFATYYMATRPELQAKVYQEIQEVVKESGGVINYDALNKMNYLEMFMQETTRLHPPAPRTERKAVKDYKVPDSDLVIKAGNLVAIPIMSFHRDEKYYPEPEKFDPERFNAENKASRPQFAYMPFGQGPRNCIGMRFSLIATKAAMAQLVQHFEIVPSKDTMVPLQMEDSSGVIKPASGLKVAFKPRV